jgi:hypothetical protein
MAQNNRLFLLNTISPLVKNKKLTPAKIYEFYHRKIGEKQAQKYKQLQFVFDILYVASRKLDVNTEDPELIQKQNEQMALLATVEREIRDNMFKADSEFLNALKVALNYNYQQ